MNKVRFEYLDSLRGLAALIVLFVHYLCAFYPYTVFGNQGSYQQHSRLESLVFYPPFGLSTAGQFAVCLFFILSGFVLSYNLLDKPLAFSKAAGLCLKRPIRLGGLVLFSIIVYSLFWYFNIYSNVQAAEITGSKPWFSGFWSGNFDFKLFFYNISTSLFSEGTLYNPALWTIEIELYGSLMIYAFMLFFSNSKFRTALTLILICVFYNSLYQGFWLGLFLADLAKRDLFKKINFNRFWNWLFFAIFIYLVSYPNYVDSQFIKSTIYGILPDDNGFGGGYPMLTAFLAFALVLSNEKLKNLLNSKKLLFLGEISYGLYVMHLLVLGSLSAWLFNILREPLGYTPAFIVITLVGAVVSIVVAYLCTHYVDKPSIYVANKVSQKIISLFTRQFWSDLFSKKQKINANSDESSNLHSP